MFSGSDPFPGYLIIYLNLVYLVYKLTILLVQKPVLGKKENDGEDWVCCRMTDTAGK